MMTKNQKPIEKYDILLKAALLQQMEQEEKLFEQEKIKLKEQYSPTDEQRQKFYEQYLPKKRKTKITQRFGRYAVRTAACLFVMMILSTVLICSVSAFRNKALEILINISGETASINLDTGVYLSWSGTDYPTYVPEGYELVSVSLTDDIKQMEFRNNDNKSLYFMQQSNKVTGMIDSENLQEQEEIVIGDTIGYYSYKNGVSVMTWDYRDNIYSLQGEIGKDEMVLIAVSTQH